ncbi:hypothetical protein ACWEFD_17725 [Streptomyces ardesiacus]
MLDLYLTLLGIAMPVVLAVPVWGPLLLAGMVAVLVWQRRVARRAVPGHVRADVRTCADTDPDAPTSSLATCADTGPDVSADTRTDESGHEARGEQ